jgi:hypothetical protein
MYYIAFFPDFRPLVRICLTKFVDNNFDYTWISNNGSTKKFTFSTPLPDLDDDPNGIPNVGEMKSWHIHGEWKDSSFLDVLLTGQLSLETINTFFQQMSRKYSWCLSPWGSVGSFFGFVFISSDENLRNKFISIVEGIELKIKYLSIPERQPRCISKYDADECISKLIQCILFTVDLNFLGARIWEFAKSVDLFPPLIIINSLGYPCKENASSHHIYFSDNYQGSIEDGFNEQSLVDVMNNVHDDNSCFWNNFDKDFDEVYPGKYQKIGRAACFDESGAMFNVFDIEQWSDRRLFNQVCRFYSNFDPTIQIIMPFPKCNDFQALRNILSIIGNSKYGLSDDIVMMPELLNQTEWLIGIRRPLEDGESNCIFISKDNYNVRQFIDIECSDGLSVISCF